MIGIKNIVLYNPATGCQCIYESIGSSHHSICEFRKKGEIYGTENKKIDVPIYKTTTTCQCVYEFIGTSHQKCCTFPLQHRIDKIDSDEIYGEIYNQTFFSGTIYDQKQVVAKYLSKTPVSNDDCTNKLHELAGKRIIKYGFKAGVIGFIFSGNHPSLIDSFIKHVCETLWKKQANEGLIYEWHGKNNNALIGFWINVDTRKYHINRRSLSLLEVLKLYNSIIYDQPICYFLPKKYQESIKDLIS